jgi:endonuclease/exonuclease/phosphatase (EEP) superfamily protein YafD
MPEPINVGTINTQRTKSWAPRAKAFAHEIDQMGLHLIGFQENAEYEDTLIHDMTPEITGDWMVTSDYVNCPTMARADLFERVKHNGKNQIPIKMRTVPFVRYRYGSAALLRRKSDGFVFVLASLHLSNNGESAHAATDRPLQAEDAWRALEAWGVTDFPMIIVGDFNDKRFAPEGPAGVLVNHGCADVLKALSLPARIDRAFVKGFVPNQMAVRPIPSTLSDHDAIRFTVTPGDVVVPPPAPKPAPPKNAFGVYRVVNPEGMWARNRDMSQFKKRRPGFLITTGRRFVTAKHPITGETGKWLETLARKRYWFHPDYLEKVV